MPVRLQERKVTRKPMAQSMGLAMVTLPDHIVPLQLKNLMPVGTAIQPALDGEEWPQHLPGDAHVVGPDDG